MWASVTQHMPAAPSTALQTLMETDSVSARGGIIFPSMHSHSIMYWSGSCDGIFYTSESAPDVRHFIESLRRAESGTQKELLKMNRGWKMRMHFIKPRLFPSALRLGDSKSVALVLCLFDCRVSEYVSQLMFGFIAWCCWILGWQTFNVVTFR